LEHAPGGFELGAVRQDPAEGFDLVDIEEVT